MCRSPMPSRFDRSRCTWCGGILPPSVRAMYAIEQELEGIPSGKAILAVVLVMIAMALLAIGRITLVASQHDPVPPSLSAHYELEGGGR